MPNHVLANVGGTKKWPYLAHDHARTSRINNQAEQNIPISLFVKKDFGTVIKLRVFTTRLT
jgi:hypothetical protein